MGKVNRKKNKRGKGPTVHAGAVFTGSTDVSFVNETGDGIADLVIEHEVLIDQRPFQKTRMIWAALDADVQAEMEAICERHGIEDADLEFKHFRQLVKYWRRFTRALKDMNDLGDRTADLLGEPKEAE